MTIEKPSLVEVIPPTTRVPEYLFKLQNGQFIYVSVNKEFSFDSFKLFIGRSSRLKELAIQDVNRYFDGGTTFVKTSEGTLYSPSRVYKDKSPSWKDQEIQRLDPSDFLIEETETIVRVTRKKAP